MTDDQSQQLQMTVSQVEAGSLPASAIREVLRLVVEYATDDQLLWIAKQIMNKEV